MLLAVVVGIFCVIGMIQMFQTIKARKEGVKEPKYEKPLGVPSTIEFLMLNGADARVNRIGCEHIVEALNNNTISFEEAYSELIEYGIGANKAADIIEYFSNKVVENVKSNEEEYQDINTGKKASEELNNKDASNDAIGVLSTNNVKKNENIVSAEKMIMDLSKSKKILTLKEIIIETDMEIEDITSALKKLYGLGLVKPINLENGKTVYDFSY
jgi:hypothetical protein